jgi:hypothetical protein
MHAKLAFPDVYRDVLDLAGKETPALLNGISSRPRAAIAASTTYAQFCSDVTSRCR